MKGNCYTPPRTDTQLDSTFVTQSELDSFATTVNSVDSTLSNQISALNTTVNGLNLSTIAGTLPISKGGTGTTTAFDASSALMPFASTSASAVKCGNRSDGSFAVYRVGHLAWFKCNLIVGGYNSYTAGTTIASGFRPSYTVRIPITMMASSNVNGYGWLSITTSGTINIHTSTTSDAEICGDCWYTIPY